MLISCTAVLQWCPTIVPKQLLGPSSSLAILQPFSDTISASNEVRTC